MEEPFILSFYIIIIIDEKMFHMSSGIEDIFWLKFVWGRVEIGENT